MSVLLVNANVRSCGSLRCPPLLTLPQGEPVQVLHLENGWYNVRFGDNQAGWIYGKYVCIDEQLDKGR